MRLGWRADPLADRQRTDRDRRSRRWPGASLGHPAVAVANARDSLGAAPQSSDDLGATASQLVAARGHVAPPR